MKLRIIFHISLVPLLIVMLVVCHLWLSEIVSGFVEMRKNDASVVASLLTDNWDGIQSLTEEEKNNLKNNLNPKYAGVDVKVLGNVAFVLLYALFATSILWAIELAIKKYKENKHNN